MASMMMPIMSNAGDFLVYTIVEFSYVMIIFILLIIFIGGLLNSLILSLG
jgi:hypothetical protein